MKGLSEWKLVIIFSNQIGSLARAYFDSVAHSKFLMGATLNDFLSKLVYLYLSLFPILQQTLNIQDSSMNSYKTLS